MLSDIVEHSKQLFVRRVVAHARQCGGRHLPSDCVRNQVRHTLDGRSLRPAHTLGRVHGVSHNVFATFSAGLCSAAMYYVYNKTNNLIVSAIFSSVISCGNASLDCLITEVFPTNLRATGVAVSMVAARLGGIIGNVVIAALLDTYCPAPTFIVAVLLAGGGLIFNQKYLNSGTAPL
ncbi:unnamed protein product [Leptidea sinapis]|uniref:Major facilitator superfamily (MFS) profile domain-containing protein n=1 Tax=Leptidea sinapis TaxID=189913 RepID=A0A5E4PQ19_9NEOP|nr:unnamed protein product [Leptidea sinapis]